MGKDIVFNLKIQTQIEDAVRKFNELGKAFGNLDGKGISSVNNTLDNLSKTLDSVRAKASTPIRSAGAMNSLEKDGDKINQIYKDLGDKIKELNSLSTKQKIDLLPKDQADRLKSLMTIMDSTNKKTKDAITHEAERNKILKNQISNQDKLAKQRKLLESQQTEKTNAINAKKQAEEQKTAADAYLNQLKEIEKLEKERDTKSRQSTKDKYEERIQAAKAQLPDKGYTQEEIEGINQAYADATKNVEVYTNAVALTEKNIKNLEAEESSLKTSLERVDKAIKDGVPDVNQLQAAYNELKQKARESGVSLRGLGDEATTDNFDTLIQRCQNLIDKGLRPVDSALSEASTAYNTLGSSVENLNGQIEQSAKEFQAQGEAAGEVSGLLSRIKQFTGLTGAAILMRRALRNAFQTIKELDKQMTAMAVVTELDVGDYWKQLPEHTERANQLGMAIKDVYEAETLYYQQGLKTAQVTKLSTSTLKMARIAGLSAEDATNKMTAALRGFNMEINETNADRVADVYSKLAAITASNVQEISSAMTKTASIASSAGMEFETTAAFLSQIIETTRESAETAGTALKTVIARFQELKKAPEEIGEVDGEIIDANKIETALRSVGVALRDTSGQFRDLDDVFIELASKWDTLDMNTQRYIATIAAGSRQQSRFVAMMSDYSRTQELVNAANNAAGASNQQFQKTLESLESKLAALTNAWNTFTMGIANSTLVKGAIDILTGILNTINKVTNAFGEWPGLALKLGLVTTALIAGAKALKAFEMSYKAADASLGVFGKSLAGIRGIFTSAIKKTQTFGVAIKGNTTILNNYATAFKTAQNATMKAKAAEEAATKAKHEYYVAMGADNKAQHTNIALQQAAAEAKKKNSVASAAATEATKEQAAADGVLATSQAQLIAEYNLSTTEQQALNVALGQGIAMDDAMILAKAGVSAETIKGLSAQEAEILANQLQNKTGLKGLWIRLQTKAAILLEKLGLGGLIKIKHVDAVATNTQTGSQTALNLVTWAGCPPMLALAAAILVVVAALAILVVSVLAIVAAFKFLQANSPEGKLKSATAALEATSKAADQAAENYKELKDAFIELTDKYKAIDELTIGTQEWRDALQEVNTEIMNLIEKYPKLSTAVTVDQYGVLRLNKEQANLILDEYGVTKAQAQNAKLVAQNLKKEAELNVKYSNLTDKAVAGDQTAAGLGGMAIGGAAGMALGPVTLPFTGAIGSAIVGLGGAALGGYIGYKTSRSQNKADTDKLAKELAKNNAVYDENGKIDSDALKNIIDKAGISETVAEEWIKELDAATLKELRQYGIELNNAADASEKATQTMIANIMAYIDATKYTSQEIAQISNVGTEAMKYALEQAETSVNKQELIRLLEGLGVNSLGWPGQIMANFMQDKLSQAWNKDSDYLQYFEDIYGEGLVKIAADGAVKAYKDGKWEEVLEGAVARESYAVSQASEALAELVEELPNRIKTSVISAGKESQYKGLNRVFADATGLTLTQKDLKDINIEADNGEAIFKELYDKESEYWDQLYGSEEAFLTEMVKRVEAAQTAFADNKKKLEQIGLGGITIDEDIDAKAQKALISHLDQVVSVSGTAAGEQLTNVVNDLLASAVTVEDKEKLISQLNAIDWHSATALEQLPETLHNVGAAFDPTLLNTFIDSAKTAAHSLHDVDLTKLNEQIRTLMAIVRDIDLNDQGRTFTEEAYKAIIAVDSTLARQFQTDLDGQYIYLGKSMDALKDAILKATQLQVEEASDVTSEKIKTADVLDTIIGVGEEKGTNTFGSGKHISLDTVSLWNEDDKKEFLQKVQEEAKQQGVELFKVTKWMATDSDLDDSVYTEERMDQIIKDLQGYYGQQQNLRDEALQKTIQALIDTNLREDTYYATRSNTLNKAETQELSNDEVNRYIAARSSIRIQATSLGFTDEELKSFDSINSKMRELEREGKTGTDTYKTYAKMMNKFMKSISKKTSFEDMYQGMKKNIEATNTLMETYKATTNEMEKQFLVSQMMSEFDLTVTEDNYQRIAEYTDAYLQGSEQGLINIINMSGAQATRLGDIYHSVSKQTEKDIQKLGDDVLDFVKKMEAAGYGRWDATTGRFHWGTDVAMNIVKDEVDKIEAWEQPYDWLWNANQKLNAVIRQRNLLEKEYQRMLNRHTDSVQTLSSNLNSQVTLLTQEAQIQQGIFSEAEKELESLLNDKNNKAYAQLLKNYIGVGPNGRLVLDKDELYEQHYTSEAGELIETMVDKVQSLIDTRNAAQDSLYDIGDQLYEIRQTGKDQYNSLLDRVTDALRTQYQKEIDKLSNINDAINDAQEKLVSKIQEKIDDDRQAREREKQRTELSNKETRLTYLQASGGSALEILQLQKDITNDRQSLQDNLVDDAVSEMERANQQAADQRQEQIDIAQAQYDWWSENKAIHDAQEVLDESLKQIQDQVKPENTRIADLLSGSESVAAQSTQGIKDWYDELNTNADMAAIYRGITDDTETGVVGTLTRNLKDGEASVASIANAINQDLANYNLGNTDLLTKLGTIEYTEIEEDAKLKALSDKLDKIKQTYIPGELQEGRQYRGGHYDVPTYDQQMKEDLALTGGIKKSLEDKYQKIIDSIVQRGNTFSYIDPDDYYMYSFSSEQAAVEDILKKRAKELKKYGFASGGLADFTGPAWLDGTQSAPELVLNATDTANFIALKDILSEVMRNARDRSNSASTGDNYYDIDVHVDSIDSDYDVDQAVERMKELIEADAMYRNVNVVQTSR